MMSMDQFKVRKILRVYVTLWLCSVGVLIVLMGHLHETAPRVYIKWNVSGVNSTKDVDVRGVVITDSKLIIVLGNGEVFEKYIPTEIIVSKDYERVVTLLTLDLFVGLAIAILLSELLS